MKRVYPMNVEEALKPLLGELRAGLEALYGHRLAGLLLYGSRARGDAEAGSDLDVLVALRGQVSPGEEIERTSGLLASLSLRHNEVVSCVFMSEERLRHEQSPLLLNVRREGLPV